MFKPMLAQAVELDEKGNIVSPLKYPLLASIKLDGIRATVQGGQLLSRSLKPIPNKNIQKKFECLPDGLDGELIYGDPAAKDCFNKTTSIVMSHDADITGVVFYVFDMFHSTDDFQVRQWNVLEYIFERVDIERVFQKFIQNETQLLEYETTILEQGHEGIMLRSLDGLYKQGRATVKQGYLLKLKRFVDGEAVITGFYEEMENQNEAVTNLLGRTERSTKKEGKVGKGTLGGFMVRDISSNVDFEVGGGLTAVQRSEYWRDRQKLVGKIIKYKHFKVGSVVKPRFPVFLGFRDERDMS